MREFEHERAKTPAELVGPDALTEEELEQEDRFWKEILGVNEEDQKAMRALIEKIKAERTRFLTSQEFGMLYARLHSGASEEDGQLRVAGSNFGTLEVYLNIERTPQEFQDPIATHEAVELIFASRLPPLDDKKPAHQRALPYEYERAAELGILERYHYWQLGEFQRLIELSTPRAPKEAVEEANEELKVREQLFQRAKQKLAQHQKHE